MGESPRVFISYSHDSDVHRKRVLALAQRLREDGIEADLDQFVTGTPPEKWPRWMLNRLDWADFVLLVCTPTYYRRFRGHEEPGKGQGVDWEGAVITDTVYADRSASLKFVPVLFDPADRGSIPEPARGHSFYSVDSSLGYQGLYDFLLGQSGAEARPLGLLKPKARDRTEPLRFPADKGEPAPARAESKRFFVSYRRRAEPDRGLATALVEGLAGAGHEVFIDVQMPIGTAWVAEIERRIGWCDYLVVLLSEDSIQSEMVQGEVRRAHRRREQEGRPAILPIRVGYPGSLGYELDSWLAPIQQRLWSGPGDSEALLAEIIRIAATGAEAGDAPRPSEHTQPIATPDPRRPLPAKDPRILRVPGGALRLDDPFYIRRAADERIDFVASSPGETLVIQGPRQMGKSSLLVRYLQACRAAGKRLAYVDFQGFGGDDLTDLPTLLDRLAAALLRALRLPAPAIPKLSSPLDFTGFVEDGILARTDGPVAFAFAFDEVDRVLGRPYQRDFFAMLRMWHNYRAQPSSPWEDVDLALVIATEPYLLIDAADQSPFNVSSPVDLRGFSRAQIERLNAGYGGPLEAPALDELFDLLGGQPYLTRLALYCIAGTPAMTWAGLVDQAASTEGPFGDHLKALLFKLDRQPGLLAALRQAIRHGTLPDEATYYRLRGAGLVTRDNGRIRPANALYARFVGALG